MATLEPGFMLNGRVAKLVSYKRHDSDKTFVRSKGGIASNRLKKSDEFVNTRKANREFGGRSIASGFLMRALWPMKQLADYNIAGPINARIRPIQEMDEVNEWGKRSIIFTKYPRLFEGFDYNRRHPFDSIVRNPMHFTLTKDSLQSGIDIPALLPDINFHVPGKYPMYCFVVKVASLPDLYSTDMGYQPTEQYKAAFAEATTDWYPVLSGSPAITLNMTLPFIPADACLMMGIGIRFGTMIAGSFVQQVKRAGSAKILAVV